MKSVDKILQQAPAPHIPDKLPIDLTRIISDPEVIKLIGQSNNALGAYKGFLLNTANPMLLISPLITQEAVLSSKLEGTHATIDDFLNYDAGNDVPIAKDEMHEVANYREALFIALKKMSTINDNSDKGRNKLPLSTRLIKEIHKVLLSNVRGSTKNPGEFKRAQNYIGSRQSITFTPLPPMLTDEYMSNLEKYIHYDEIDVLLQAALMHVQFEMIHPFEDGNGRIGRLLIPLFLYYREVLPYPTFYMSSYFEADRALYLQMLSSVSQNDDFVPWIKYFLNGIIDQSQENTRKANSLLTLYDNYKEICLSKMKSRYAINLLDFIFIQPIFKAQQVQKEIEVSNATIYNVINEFIQFGILERGKERRNITYYCPEIIKVL